jgi:hypothetical protein
MRRAVGVLLIAVLLIACGGSPGGGGGGGGGGGPAEVPPLSLVWFGSSFDPAACGVVGRFPSAKQGSPLFAVGHLFPTHDPADLSVEILIGGSVRAKAPLSPCTGGAPDSVAADLTGTGLGPGVYIVSFVSAKGTTFATGNLSITAP